jgi:hypothetical protein
MILEVITTIKYLSRDDKTIPASLIRNINSVGSQYEYQKANGKEIFFEISGKSILTQY